MKSTPNKSDLLTAGNKVADELGEDTPDQLALLDGLTDQQQTIARFKMRGLSQKAIAKFLSVSAARVSQEVKAIREHHISRGSDVNQAALVGETVTLYEEVEKKGWEVFHADESKRLRALDTVMKARESQMKMMMDLGLVKRAAIEHNTTVSVSPLMSSLTDEKKDAIVARIIETAPGVEPTPPEDDEDPLYEALPEDASEPEP